MNRIAALLLIAFSTACSRQVLEPSVAGVFDLQSRDGNLLPAPMPTVFDGRECLNEMLSAALTIEPTGVWAESIRVQHRCSGSGAEIIGPTSSQYSGRFDLSCDVPQLLVFTSDELKGEGHTQTAVIDGNELRLTFTEGGSKKAHAFIYRRRR
jgi:hypothetical protein